MNKEVFMEDLQPKMLPGRIAGEEHENICRQSAEAAGRLRDVRPVLAGKRSV